MPVPNHDDSLEPSPAELGNTTTLNPGEWTPLDEIGTQIYVYGEQPVDVAIQYAEVEGEIRQLRRNVEVHERRYLAVQKVLDGVLGTEATHGTGEGLVADVALLAQRYADLKARTISGGWPLVVEEVESADLRRRRVSRLGDVLVQGNPIKQDYVASPGLSSDMRWIRADDLNALRDELIELRRIAASIPTDSQVRVYAVANLHKGRIHGITCNVNQSAAWVRALCEQYGPDAAVQCVDLVDPEQQTIAWDRGERATVNAPNATPGGAS